MNPRPPRQILTGTRRNLQKERTRNQKQGAKTDNSSSWALGPSNATAHFCSFRSRRRMPSHTCKRDIKTAMRLATCIRHAPVQSLLSSSLGFLQPCNEGLDFGRPVFKDRGNLLAQGIIIHHGRAVVPCSFRCICVQQLIETDGEQAP